MKLILTLAIVLSGRGGADKDAYVDYMEDGGSFSWKNAILGVIIIGLILLYIDNDNNKNIRR